MGSRILVGLAATFNVLGVSMHLFNVGSSVERRSSGSLSKYNRYLSHETEPLDFYRKYKDDDFIPKKGASNPRNLFDDSDIKDSHWFNIAKTYLRNKEI